MTCTRAFSLFRMSVVRQGIAARYATRQTSSGNAREIDRGMLSCTQLTQALIRRLKSSKTILGQACDSIAMFLSSQTSFFSF